MKTTEQILEWIEERIDLMSYVCAQAGRGSRGDYAGIISVGNLVELRDFITEEGQS